MKPRRCSRSACSAAAIATLTYAYAESTAVLGPLAPYVEPHSYDLCANHADRLTAPLGWAVVRLEADVGRPALAGDDLEALADVVREAAHPPAPNPPPPDDTNPSGRRHLRAVPSVS